MLAPTVAALEDAYTLAIMKRHNEFLHKAGLTSLMTCMGLIGSTAHLWQLRRQQQQKTPAEYA